MGGGAPLVGKDVPSRSADKRLVVGIGGLCIVGGELGVARAVSVRRGHQNDVFDLHSAGGSGGAGRCDGIGGGAVRPDWEDARASDRSMLVSTCNRSHVESVVTS